MGSNFWLRVAVCEDCGLPNSWRIDGKKPGPFEIGWKRGHLGLKTHLMLV